MSKRKSKKRSPFGQLLFETRKGQGVTMNNLSKAVGVSESYISLLESGARSHPSRELVLKLAETLGASPQNNWADDFLVTAGYYPTNKQVYHTHLDTVQTYRLHLKEDPNNFESFSALVYALIKLGEQQEAQLLIQKGLIQFDDAIKLQSLLASLELSKGHFQKALDFQDFALSQFKHQYPDQKEEITRFELNLGVIHFLKGYAHNNSALKALISDDQNNTENERKNAFIHFLAAAKIFKTLLGSRPSDIYLWDEYARVHFNLAHMGMGTPQDTASYWEETITYLKRVIQSDQKFILGQAALFEASVFLAHAHTQTEAFDEAETLINILEITVSPPHWLVPYLKACFFTLRAKTQKQPDDFERALKALASAINIDKKETLEQAKCDPDLKDLRETKTKEFKRLLKS